MTTTPEPVLPPPAPATMREELERLVYRDLHGPAGGDTEELIERGVRDRYLV